MRNLKVYTEIRKLLAKPITSYALQSKLQAKGLCYSESTLTRRMREMGVKPNRPKSKKTTAWTYSL